MNDVPDDDRLDEDPFLRRLHDYRQQHGDRAGDLAAALDDLTDAMALVSQHRVYCRLEKGPRKGQGTLDVEECLRLIESVKGRLKVCFRELREDR